MLFITTLLGDGYVPFLTVCLDSIAKTHPQDKVIVLWNNVSESQLIILREGFPKYDFQQNTNVNKTDDIRRDVTLKVTTWLEVCKNTNEDKICAIDCDTIVLEDISSYFDKDFDVIYTWKNEDFPLNVGVVLMKDSKKAVSFLTEWIRLMDKIFEKNETFEQAIKDDGSVDQKALHEMLGTDDFTKPFTKKFDFGELKFLGVPCDELNQTNSVPVNSGSKILHYKGGWRPILLLQQDYSKYRNEQNSAEMKAFWEERYADFSEASLKQFVLNAAEKNEKVLNWNEQVYEERGILHSEMLAIISVIKELDVDVIIESGRARGQSTKILGKVFKDIPIVSIEWQRDESAEFAEKNLAEYKNIELLYGDANDVLPKQLERFKDKRVAVLFDGPKGQDAYDCLYKSLVEYSNVDVAFFHDCRKSFRKMVNPSREQIYKYFDRLIFTDDLDYVKEFSHIDEVCVKKDNINVHSWRPYIKGFEKIGSYGPTIGIAFVNERDRFRAKKMFSKSQTQPVVQEKKSLIYRAARKIKHEILN